MRYRLLLMSLCALILVGSGHAARLDLSPSTNTVTLGSNFSVAIVLNTQGQAIDGVDVAISYNPTMLAVNDSNLGASGIQIVPGTMMSTTVYNLVNVTANKIYFSQITTAGTTFNGAGTLATIQLQAIALGTSPLTIEFTPGNTTDSNVAQNDVDFLSAVTNGAYSSIPDVDTTAPLLSVSSPVHLANYSNSSVPLIFTASDNRAISTCSYILNGARTILFFCSNQTLAAVIGTNTFSFVVNDTSNNSAVMNANFTVLDFVPPVISNIAAVNVNSTTAMITWTTDEPTDSQIDLGTTIAYGNTTPLNATLSIAHATPLGGLLPNTLYHYRVVARDLARNLRVSGDFTFTTLPAVDTTPPVISNITVSNVTASRALVRWTTDEPADGQIEYGFTTAYGSLTSLNPNLTIQHAQMITGLVMNSLYHYRINSRDGPRNLRVTGDLSFITTSIDLDPPTISITSPTNGATIANMTNITTNVADDVGISNVEFFIDGVSAGNITTAPYTFPLDARSLTNGSHTILAIATDGANNQASASISVTVLASAPVRVYSIVISIEGMTNTAISGTLYARSPITKSILSTNNFTTATNGTYNTLLTGLPQVVEFRIIIPGYLASLLTADLSAVTVITIPRLRAGDLNGDGIINSIDWSVMNGNWLRPHPTADFNRDGAINTLDWGLMNKNWLLQES